MSKPGVLYTEYSSLTTLSSHFTSLWSFESRSNRGDRQPVAVNSDSNHEFWLDRSDPLLNVMLPDTSISLMINFADPGAVGQSLATAAFLPGASVLGPVTRAQLVTLGRTVRAVGAGLDPTIALQVFGARAAELVNRAVPLHTFWGASEVHELTTSMSRLELGQCASVLKSEIERRFDRVRDMCAIERATTDLIRAQHGRLSVEEMTRYLGVGRQRLARRFRDTVGLSPKLFARITRCQHLVRALLMTDVSQWAAVATSVGYYDQAHMVNEFRFFAGESPTLFFQPRGKARQRRVQIAGRPSQWV